MTEVVISGIGMIPPGEHWELSLRSLAASAILAARKEAPELQPEAMYIGNFLGSSLSRQANLGALLTDNVGLGGIEGLTVEAAEASAAGAFRLAYLAIRSGFVKTALVVGVEKFTDVVGNRAESAVAEGLDYDYENISGLTATGAAALLMQRYLHEYGVPRESFGAFACLAQGNAVANPSAYFRKPLKLETYRDAPIVCDPLNLYDAAPMLDGAAVLILTRADALEGKLDHPLVVVSGSAVAVDALSLHDRPEPLAFHAAAESLHQACRQAGIQPGDADLFELADSATIYAALILEAAGLAPRGESCRMAEAGEFAREGRLPISTLGGMKGRGNPLGAGGAYQLVEAVLQLRGEAGAGQVKDARRALVQSLGGPAGTAVTHVLERA
jgi:acetyl-CoA C-acetyltransferase